jgi:hypothetical protein
MNDGGKGSKQRPTDKKAFDSGWDRIFGTKLCPECGKKECPKATHHNLRCSGKQPESK